MNHENRPRDFRLFNIFINQLFLLLQKKKDMGYCILFCFGHSTSYCINANFLGIVVFNLKSTEKVLVIQNKKRSYQIRYDLEKLHEIEDYNIHYNYPQYKRYKKLFDWDLLVLLFSFPG